MRLEALEVEKLYGRFCYDVEFNSDITLLYGENGCGKTTILNIVTDIITGQIYKLLAIEFEYIGLVYSGDSDNKKSKLSLSKNSDGIEIVFNNEKSLIQKIEFSEERIKRRRIDERWIAYKEAYPILDSISKEFNYVYLSLDRSAYKRDYDDYYYTRRVFSNDDIQTPEEIDIEIRHVEELVSKAHREISSETQQINIGFRNAILKSALNVKKESSTSVNALDEKKINTISKAYFKIMDDLKLIDDNEKKKIVDIFTYYKEAYKRIIPQEKKASVDDISELLSYMHFCYEMKRIQDIVDYAEKAEKQKKEASRPIEVFLEIVNEFIASSSIKKEIHIDDMYGNIYFTTEDNEKKLHIQYLSSGERQLIIFFAYLLFDVSNDKSGIFVVDEPELSLHLSWQKVFIDKALQANKNVQFIFATHAPEIIGRRDNKTRKLERRISDK